MTIRHAPWEESGEFRIGLNPIPAEAWLEGGEADPAARKDPLYNGRTAAVWAAMDRSRPGQTEVLYAPAGTVFVTRGSDFHKVVTPIKKKRCLFAARFCINELPYPGPDRDDDAIPGEEVARRVGDDAQLRHVTRMRFDWGGKRFS